MQAAWPQSCCQLTRPCSIFPYLVAALQGCTPIGWICWLLWMMCKIVTCREAHL